MKSIVNGMHGNPTPLAQLPAAKEPRQRSEQNLWKNPVKERVLEKTRRQFHAITMNALLQVTTNIQRYNGKLNSKLDINVSS